MRIAIAANTVRIAILHTPGSAVEPKHMCLRSAQADIAARPATAMQTTVSENSIVPEMSMRIGHYQRARSHLGVLHSAACVDDSVALAVPCTDPHSIYNIITTLRFDQGVSLSASSLPAWCSHHGHGAAGSHTSRQAHNPAMSSRPSAHVHIHPHTHTHQE